MSKVFAFDFDGLLVDGLNECVLVSWNGFHNKGIEHFGPEGLDAIPASFIDTFKNHRNFSRHLGHFITPFYAHKHFKNQIDFDDAYSQIDEKVVNGFVERVNLYRKAARQTQYKQWIQYHSFYTGVENLLKDISYPIYIVTGKDATSVSEILQYSNIHIPSEKIFGECREKVNVLRNIAQMEHAKMSEVLFFDDNITNAINAHKNGFNSYWATWGYNAPDHWDIAKESEVPIISLHDFHEMGLVEEVET
ncbi:HAD family hydrolase [Sulfurirhabdus autotrophica]|uniref:Phosphoglycolate phosphatase-like HAD superfamily hydrolase n=1 Tax=Sulfurirhabdus autotrophica TaxID=1706046 RepID=A0A4R3XRV0_9PROT|nr:HAD family hydrolase [Sulfurirhabdus autotrophica]TCV79977.1 phosphoglycolate phosphatase-like HAD superfamily hydrolase [Sulfurirhabdus autotrophica]